MTVVPLDDPAGRTRWEFEHDGRRFLVLHHAGRWFVVDALCPHRQGRLADGTIRGDVLVCPSHWYTFELGTGACRTTSELRLGTYEVRDADGRLAVDIPERVHRSWSEILRSHARSVPPERTSAAGDQPSRHDDARA